MQTRDSILLHPFAFIALAVVTVSTPLRAQIVGDRVRLFTADTTIIGQVTDMTPESWTPHHCGVDLRERRCAG